MGHRMAGHARRARGHPVHLLPAMWRGGSRSHLRRTHLRLGAAVCFPARRGFDLRHRVGARPGDGQGSEIWRRASGRRAAVLGIQLEAADVQSAWKHFELCEAECKKLIERYGVLSKSEGDGIAREKSRFPLLGAYDLCLKCSHYFNILDARGAISVTERVGVIARVRALAVGIAKAWMDQQYPTEKKTESNNQAAKAGAKEKKGKLAPVG